MMKSIKIIKVWLLPKVRVIKVDFIYSEKNYRKACKEHDDNYGMKIIEEKKENNEKR